MVRSYKNILLSTLILGASMGVGTNVFATDPEVDLSVTVNPSLTLSVSSNTVNLPITPDADGEYNTTNFTITSATNNMYGYTLTMSTEDNHTYLESTTVDPTTGTKPQIQSLASSQDGISAETFAAATTEANGLNRWGIAIGSGNYNAVTSPKEVKKTTTNNASGVDNTTVNIAAKLNLAIPAGTYKNKFIIQMVANPLPGGLEEAYQNAGKTKATIGGKQYYAMQDMTSTICNNVSLIGDVIEVYDTRDNTIYHIGKLADNRCWLLDNLALDPVANGSSLTQSNTNATQAAIDNYLNSSGVAPQAGWTTTSVSYNSPAHSENGFNPVINITSKDIIPSTYYDEDEGEYYDDPLKNEMDNGGWKVGVYYNYCAATVGTYCYTKDGPDAEGDNNPDIDAIYDICPAGWRMPTSGYTDSSKGEYGVLLEAVTGETGYYVLDPIKLEAFRLSLHLPKSGHDENYSQGVDGYFHSSTVYYPTNPFLLYVGSEISTAAYEWAPYLFSVRCINKTGTEPAPSGN